jgi:Zn finger protein HypA/HybF involved in hydrogenase expression
LHCPACGGFEVHIVRGDELSVESLEVTDEHPVLEEVT